MKSSYLLFFRHGQRVVGTDIIGRSNPVPKTLGVFNYTQWEKEVNKENIRLQSFKNFPVNISNNSAEAYFAASSYPYGYLTRLGEETLNKQGEKFAKFLKKKEGTVTKDYFTPDNFNIISTNYNRTQLSAQNFLSGFFNETLGSSNSINVPIEVKSLGECPITFYEANKEIAHALVDRVLAKDSVKEIENEKDVVKSREKLIELFPRLGAHRTGFNWPTAFDIFTCHKAHGLQLDKELLEHENICLRHFIRRYWCYYNDQEHFSFFITPLLKDIIKKIEKIHYSSNSSISLYSCHDINLYGLLTLFGVLDIVEPNLKLLNIDNYESAWPFYGSTLCLEIKKGGEEILGEGEVIKLNETYINIYWDEKLVKVNLDRIDKLNDISPPNFSSSTTPILQTSPSITPSNLTSTITLSQLKDLYSYLISIKNSSDLIKISNIDNKYASLTS